MNRNTLERLTASLVVLLITIFMFGVILIFANLIFQWDIFTPFVEKIMYFLALVFLVVILACTLVNIMLNISRMAHFSEKITEKLYEKK
jgi:hypothetical protein